MMQGEPVLEPDSNVDQTNVDSNELLVSALQVSFCKVCRNQ